jgi:pimeloyl-ACP methyl ester carboxylesterase
VAPTATVVPPLGRVGEVAYTTLGEGLPVTVFAHGLGGSASETRPLASRVPGTRILLSFRGHGDSGDLPGGWDYDVLAEDLRAVADATGARCAVGLSLGAGALMRVLAGDPYRFDRVAFVLPAAIDATRADGATLRLEALGDAIDAGDADAVTAILMSEVPAAVRTRRGVSTLVRRRAVQLSSRPAPRPLRDDRPLVDRAVLGTVHVPALVIGQDADPLHRLDVAQELAAALPQGRLVSLPEGGVFWGSARDAQDALAHHVTGGTA